MGGTEILYSQLSSRLNFDDINLITSVCDPARLHPTKPNILWQHLSYDQPNVQNLKNPDMVAKYDAIVFVSHWQHDHFRRHFPIPGSKCYVIQNATEKVTLYVKPKAHKLRLIYTSTPWRGLKMLVQAYKNLNRKDVELLVYSGTSIYGPQFYANEHHKWAPLYEELKQLPNTTHYEYATNAEIKKALTQAHIMAYPNTWEETSCLAAIEALAAGCKVVTTSYGALPETCGHWADYIPASGDMVDRYTNLLDKAIDEYWSEETQYKLLDQVTHYNRYWTWEARLPQWIGLFKEFKNGRKVDSEGNQEARRAA
jgi:glycosyltransferase involved in cell wall biosynthesis